MDIKTAGENLQAHLDTHFKVGSCSVGITTDNSLIIYEHVATLSKHRFIDRYSGYPVTYEYVGKFKPA